MICNDNSCDFKRGIGILPYFQTELYKNLI